MSVLVESWSELPEPAVGCPRMNDLMNNHAGNLVMKAGSGLNEAPTPRAFGLLEKGESQK